MGTLSFTGREEEPRQAKWGQVYSQLQIASPTPHPREVQGSGGVRVSAESTRCVHNACEGPWELGGSCLIWFRAALGGGHSSEDP